jgi:hypothetical protein
MPESVHEIPLAELIVRLRQAAAIWFKNDDVMLLEELIRRMLKYRQG